MFFGNFWGLRLLPFGQCAFAASAFALRAMRLRCRAIAPRAIRAAEPAYLRCKYGRPARLCSRGGLRACAAPLSEVCRLQSAVCRPPSAARAAFSVQRSQLGAWISSAADGRTPVSGQPNAKLRMQSAKRSADGRQPTPNHIFRAPSVV